MKFIIKALLMVVLSLIFFNFPEYSYSEELNTLQNPQGNTTSNTLTNGTSVINAPLSNTTTGTPAQIPPEIGLCIPKSQVSITLEESLETAMENNYDIKVVTAQKNRDKWLYYSSLTEFLPDVSLNYSKIRFQGAFLIGGVVAAPTGLLPTGPFNTTTVGVTADWVAFNGFGRYFDARAARSTYKATRRNIDLTKDQTLLQTTRQYYSLLQSKLNIEILQRALAQTQAQLTLNQQRFQTGVGTRFDVLRAEAEVASARQNLISAYNNFKLAQAQLAYILGINVFTPLMPNDNEAAAKTLFKDCFDLEKVTQIAMQNKPELDIARLNVEATRARRNSGYSIYFPTVTMGVQENGVGTELSDLNSSNLLSLSVVWNGGQGLGLTGFTNIKALNEQVKESKLRLTDTKRIIEQSLISSYNNVITAKELIDASRSQVVSAEESLRLSLVRLSAGVGIYTDVINAQLTETQARINYLNSLVNYNISQAQLLYDMGVISAVNLLSGFSAQDADETLNKKKSTK